MPKSVATAVFDASPDACYRVIWDVAGYPAFLKDMRNVKILRDGETQKQAEFTLKLIKEVKYTVDLVGVPGKSVRWTLLKGFMKKNDGGWTLRDLGNGRTEAVYDIDLELPALVPGRIIKMLQEKELPKMMESFARRIKGLV